MIYTFIGRWTVRLVLRFIRKKVGTRTVVIAGAGAVAGITAITVVGYLAARDVPEA